MLNRTRYRDGRQEKITYHATHEQAIVEALRDSGDPAIISTSQESIDYFAGCPCGSQWKFKYCCLPRYLAAQNEEAVRRRASIELLNEQMRAVTPPPHARCHKLIAGKVRSGEPSDERPG